MLQSDVLVIDGRHLRLADALTPQPAPGAHCTAEALAAHQVSLRLKSLAQGVHTAMVIPTGKMDGDERQYAHIFLDGADPAKTLIEEGLAVAPDKPSFDWCAPLSASLPEAQHIAALSFEGS